MEKWLKEIMPIMGIEHDCILSKQGDVTVAFKVELPEIFSLSETDYEAFHSTWVKAIRLLPKFSVLHKQDWFIERKFKPDFTQCAQLDDVPFLNRASDRFFNERPFLDHTCFLFLTKKPAGRKVSSSMFSNLIRPSLVPNDVLQPKMLQDFLDSAGQFKRILEDSGFAKLHLQTADQLESQYRSIGIIERYFTLPSADQPEPADIEFGDDIKVGGKYVQLYTLSDAEYLPSLASSRTNYEKYSSDRTKFSVGFSSSLGQLLPCDHIYNQYIFIDDAAQTLKRLEGKRLRLQSLSAYSRENSISRDATNDFLNEAISEQRQPVKAHYNIQVWTPQKEELKNLKNLVSSALAQMDAVAKMETSGAAQIWWSGIPGNSADFPINDTFDTFIEQAACFLNLETCYQSSVSPFGLRLGDRLTGRPLHVDISDWPMSAGIIQNRSKFLIGPSGSGKSFLCNHLLRSYYEQGTHIVIVDVGHSYRGLCDMLGGYYFTYEEHNPIRFNPFFIPQGDSLDSEKKESIKTLLLALWKNESEEYKRSEYVALSSAVNLYFDTLDQHPEIFPCFNSFYEFLLTDFVAKMETERVKEKDFDLNNFLYVLKPFYRNGEYDYLLNATENLDLLHERFIVFELDAIKENVILYGITVIIIMEMFVNKMRKLKGIRKMIVIEEAWKALMKENFAGHIKYLWKTIRKFFGEALIVTQEIEDIISSHIVKEAIINNSDCKILLDQSKYQNKFDKVQELLGLTNKEKALVLSLNKSNDPTKKYKEVFISLGGTHSRVYRTEVSPEEYLAYTTEQREKEEVQKNAKKYGSLQKGIEMMVRQQKEKK